MNIVVKARHMDVTDSIRQHIEAKAAKLPRLYDNIQSIEVILDVEADKPVVETIVMARRTNKPFVAHHRGENMYTCIDQCFHKITQQLRRHKDKVRDHHGPPHSETMQPGGQ